MLEDHLHSDKELLEGCVKQEPAAWAAFAKKYKRLILSSARNRLISYGYNPTPQDIEDIHQNVLTSIWQGERLADIERIESIPYWVAIVAGNEACNHARRMRGCRQSKMLSMSDTESGRELAESLSSGSGSPLDAVTRSELSEEVSKALLLLGDRDKLIIKLHFFHDKRCREIADMLNIPTNTVLSRIKRSKKRLKLILQNMV